MSCEHDVKFRVYGYNDTDGETTMCMVCAFNKEHDTIKELIGVINKLKNKLDFAKNTLIDFADTDNWEWNKEYSPYGDAIYIYQWEKGNPMRFADDAIEYIEEESEEDF